MSLDKEIYKIAVPNIIANISIPLLGAVDTALMGRIDDPAYIGAIALGGVIFNIIYWGFGFLRPGTTGLTAQAYGEDNKQEVFYLFFRSTIIGFIIGLILWLFREPIGSFSFKLLSGSESVEALALQYFSIRILAAPAVICLFAFRGWFFGVQNALAPMFMTIFTNIVNIICSWYLVVYKNMSVEGVAWGTVIAQWLTFFVMLLFVFIRHIQEIRIYLRAQLFSGQAFLRFLTVNRDMFIRNLGLIAVFTYFTDYASQVSDEYLAATQILMQLFYLMSYGIDGFAYASESLVGKYIGAKKGEIVLRVIKKCLIYGMILGLLFSLLFMTLGDNLVAVFTSNVALIHLISPYFIWLSLVTLSGALAFIWDGIFSGATSTKSLRDSMLLSAISFFIVVFLTKEAFPEQAIWAGMIAFMLVRSGYQIFQYKRILQPQIVNLV